MSAESSFGGGWKSKSGAHVASSARACLFFSSLDVFMMLAVVPHVNQMYVLHLHRRTQKSALRVQILDESSVKAGRLTHLLCSDRKAGPALGLAADILTMNCGCTMDRVPCLADMVVGSAMPWFS